jgi:hypothetical protein
VPHHDEVVLQQSYPRSRDENCHNEQNLNLGQKSMKICARYISTLDLKYMEQRQHIWIYIISGCGYCTVYILTLWFDIRVSLEVIITRFPRDVIEVEQTDGRTFLFQCPSHTFLIHVLYNTHTIQGQGRTQSKVKVRHNPRCQGQTESTVNVRQTLRSRSDRI